MFNAIERRDSTPPNPLRLVFGGTGFYSLSFLWKGRHDDRELWFTGVWRLCVATPVQHLVVIFQENVSLGSVCFGAPIRSADGRVVAALSISQPKQRLAAHVRETLPRTLTEAVQRISTALGYR